MIPAGQPIDEDLEARKFANLQARREPDLNRTSARSHDIKIDDSQRVFVLPTSDGLGARAGIVAGALIITSGLT
jgi:hypothetical protein